MGQFKVDVRDVYFNLFELLKSEQFSKDFGVNELKDTFGEFVKFTTNEIYPTRQLSDQEGVKLENGKVLVAPSLHKPMKLYYENGWFGLGVSEKYDGILVPFSLLVACVSVENSANIAFSVYHSLSRSALNVILNVGSEEQIKLIMPKMNCGEWGGTMCLTEANAGSDVGNVSTMATPISDVKHKIKGSKIFITSGDNDLYGNMIHLVLARTPEAPKGTKGLSLFIVPKIKYDNEGTLSDLNDVTCSKVEEKMGIHSSATCELVFGENDNCEGYLLGNLNDGMKNMFMMMNEARLLCALQGEGQGHLAYTLSHQYAGDRVQFGQEIRNLPDIKRTLLNMRAMSRGLRSLVLYIGHLFDEEIRNKNIEAGVEIGLLTPIAKAFGTDEGFNLGVDAIQVHGGYGFCSEYGIEQIARDTKIGSIYEGSNGIQAIDFLTRKVLKDGGKSYNQLLKKISSLVARGKSIFPDECRLVEDSLNSLNQILADFENKFKAKNESEVLYHATDFSKFNSNLIVAWRLLESALLSKDLLDSGTVLSDKEFYESKLEDFSVFCRAYLSRNRGLAFTILGKF